MNLYSQILSPSQRELSHLFYLLGALQALWQSSDQIISVATVIVLHCSFCQQGCEPKIVRQWANYEVQWNTVDQCRHLVIIVNLLDVATEIMILDFYVVTK